MSNLFNKIAQSCERFPDKIAIQMKENGVLNAISYKDLGKSCQHGKDFLQDLGITPGSRVAVISENRPEWAVGFLSIVAADATAVILDYALTPQDIQILMNFADVKAVILSSQAKAKFGEIIPSNLPQIHLQRRLSLFGGSPKRVSKGPDEDEDPELAVIMFTSGTVGTPKGVMVKGDGILEIGFITIKEGKMTDNERILSPIPLSHIFGIAQNFAAGLLVGGTLTLLEKVNRDSLLEALNEEHITFLTGVPRLYESLITGIQQKVASKGLAAMAVFSILEKLSQWSYQIFKVNPGRSLFGKLHNAFGGQLRVMVSGGATLSPELWKKLYYWGFRLMSGYGLTETSAGACVSAYDHPEIGTVGMPIENVEVKIINPGGEGEGEICFRGPAIMKGYFRNPDATREALVNGWLHTGDLGKFTKKGNLQIFGRLKEVIVTSSGKKVTPEDVENKYRGIPGVAELVVVGVMLPSQRGEEIHAVVVPEKMGATPEDQESIKQKIAQEMHRRSIAIPSYMHIQHLHLIDAIPKTSTLKPKRLKLATQLSQAKSGEHSSLLALSGAKSEDYKDIESKLLKILYAEFPNLKKQQIKKASSLPFDLGIDSLGMLDLASSIQKVFHVKLNNSAITAALTFEDLVNLIQKTKQNGSDADQQEDHVWRKYPEITSVDRSKPLPASSLEEWVWKLVQAYPKNPAYSVSGCYDLLGELDIQAFKKAIQTIFRRHEILRTTYEMEKGNLVRKIHDIIGECHIQDLSGLSKNELDNLLPKQLYELDHRCYDPSKAPLFEVSLVKLSPTHYILKGSGSHIIFDAMSLGLMMAEISSLYQMYKEKGNADVAIKSPHIHYADFAAWQRNNRVPIAVKELTTHLTFDELKVGTFPILLQGPLFAKMQECCGQLKILLPTLLISALQILLYSYFHRNITINTLSSGRYAPQIKSTIGLFMQNLRVPADLSDASKLVDIVRANQNAMVALITTANIEGVSEDSTLNIDFNCISVDKPFELEGLQVVPRFVPEEEWYIFDPKTDLYFRLYVTGSQLAGKLNFKKNKFEENTIKQLLGAYLNLLQFIVDHPSVTVSQCAEHLLARSSG